MRARDFNHSGAALFLVSLCAVFSSLSFAEAPLTTAEVRMNANVTIGTKAFTEGYLLGEIISQKLEQAGATVSRRFGLGGTGILYEALKSRQIDAYPEYTGTIAEAILKRPELRSFDQIQSELSRRGLVMSKPFGFNNTYALAVLRPWSEKNQIRTITELAAFKGTPRAAFSHEFMTREDGYNGLKKKYQLNINTISSVEHSLSYEALAESKVDVIDTYSTDGKIEKLDLVLLEDDRHEFPQYEAVLLTRLDVQRANPALLTLVSPPQFELDDKTMTRLNRQADLEHKSFSRVASEFLGSAPTSSSEHELWSTLVLRTREHLFLVGASLLISIIVGVPLGIVASRFARFAQAILILSGVIQTIPSLALLCFLIPLFGIGTRAALVALILYSLLPIVLNTYTGLRSVDPDHRETARALGLTYFQRLRYIELPLAGSSILAGIKTSATIGIGTATLAALIGAGGYGVPIVTGLALNDLNMILVGAVPAAVLALLTHGAFQGLEHVLLPRMQRR